MKILKYEESLYIKSPGLRQVANSIYDWRVKLVTLWVTLGDYSCDNYISVYALCRGDLIVITTTTTTNNNNNNVCESIRRLVTISSSTGRSGGLLRSTAVRVCEKPGAAKRSCTHIFWQILGPAARAAPAVALLPHL